MPGVVICKPISPNPGTGAVIGAPNAVGEGRYWRRGEALVPYAVMRCASEAPGCSILSTLAQSLSRILHTGSCPKRAT